MSLYGPATAPQRKRHLLNLQFAIVYFGATCLEWRVASGEKKPADRLTAWLVEWLEYVACQTPSNCQPVAILTHISMAI